MEIIKLNLIPAGVNPICHCSQYDEGRVIRIELFDGLTPYTLQSGDTVTLNVRKPDNTIVTTSVTATQGNKYVDIVTTEQMCACVGNNLCDLTITNGSTVIGTLNFYMQIEKDVLSDGIPSQSIIKDLSSQVEELVNETLSVDYYDKDEIDDFIDPLQDKVEYLESLRIANDDIAWSAGYIKTNGKWSEQALDLWQYYSQFIDARSFTNLTIIVGENRQICIAFYDKDTGEFVNRDTNWSSENRVLNNNYSIIISIALVTGTQTEQTSQDVLSNITILSDFNRYTDDTVVLNSLINKSVLVKNGGVTASQQTSYYVKATNINVKAGDTFTAKGGYQFGIYNNTDVLVQGWTTSYTFATDRVGMTFVIRKTGAAEEIIKEKDGLYLSNYILPLVYSNNISVAALSDGAIIDLKNRPSFSKWNKSKVAFVGDSITYGVNTDVKYYEALNTMIGFSNVYADGVAGSCYSVTSNYGTSYTPISQRWQNIPTDRDLIVIFAGTNDYGHNTPIGTINDTTDISFYGALSVVINGILSANPKARLVLMTPLHRWGYNGDYPNDTDENGQGKTLKDYVDAIKNIAEMYSIPIIDLFSISGINPRISAIKTAYITDGLHPNTAGHILLANRINPILATL